MSKGKILASALSVALSGSLLVGGTMAWQSLNQEALNEVSGIVNPGGRLHDDFNGQNKDVYVENFADEPIFARVKLAEYLQLEGGNGDAIPVIGVDSDRPNGNEPKKDVTNTYFVYMPTEDSLLDASNVFRQYVDWDFAGKTVYLPTYNQNKDSLEADINGSLEGVDGEENTGEAYDDYKIYMEGVEYDVYDAVVDNDTNSVDEIVAAGKSFNTAIKNNELLETYFAEELDQGNIEIKDAKHSAKATPYANVITMREWLDNGMTIGDFWVYDTDGWAYYAKPIAPGEASGLLLDGISITRIDDNYRYDINVIAQFVTAGDVGKPSDIEPNGSGFYDTTVDFGSVPTEEAEKLLYRIGAMGYTSGSLSYTENGDGSYHVTLEGGLAPAQFFMEQNNDPNTRIETAPDGQSAIIYPGANEDSTALTVYATDTAGNTVDTIIYLPEKDTRYYSVAAGATVEIAKDKHAEISVTGAVFDSSQWSVLFVTGDTPADGVLNADYTLSGSSTIKFLRDGKLATADDIVISGVYENESSLTTIRITG